MYTEEQNGSVETPCDHRFCILHDVSEGHYLKVNKVFTLSTSILFDRGPLPLPTTRRDVDCMTKAR